MEDDSDYEDDDVFDFANATVIEGAALEGVDLNSVGVSRTSMNNSPHGLAGAGAASQSQAGASASLQMPQSSNPMEIPSNFASRCPSPKQQQQGHDPHAQTSAGLAQSVHSTGFHGSVSRFVPHSFEPAVVSSSYHSATPASAAASAAGSAVEGFAFGSYSMSAASGVFAGSSGPSEPGSAGGSVPWPYTVASPSSVNTNRPGARSYAAIARHNSVSEDTELFAQREDDGADSSRRSLLSSLLAGQAADQRDFRRRASELTPYTRYPAQAGGPAVASSVGSFGATVKARKSALPEYKEGDEEEARRSPPSSPHIGTVASPAQDQLKAEMFEEELADPVPAIPRRRSSFLQGKVVAGDGDEHLDIAQRPTPEVLELIARALQRVLNRNDSSSNAPSEASIYSHGSDVQRALLRFHSSNIPAISLEAYLVRILKYCPTTNEVFIALLVYFDRIADLTSDFVLDSYNVHRLVIAGITAASKFFSDIFYKNSRYAKVGGVPSDELNCLELEFLALVNYRLHVSVEELQIYGDLLLHNS